MPVQANTRSPTGLGNAKYLMQNSNANALNRKKLTQNLTNSNANLNWFCIKINQNNRQIIINTFYYL